MKRPVGNVFQTSRKWQINFYGLVKFTRKVLCWHENKTSPIARWSLLLFVYIEGDLLGVFIVL